MSCIASEKSKDRGMRRMKRKYAKKVCKESMQRKYAKKVCKESMQRKYAKKVCKESMQREQITVASLPGLDPPSPVLRQFFNRPIRQRELSFALICRLCLLSVGKATHLK
jgi:hypothetical protein